MEYACYFVPNSFTTRLPARWRGGRAIGVLKNGVTSYTFTSFFNLTRARTMKLGIFLPNWIGDVVMCTPALRALREHFGPAAQLVGVLRPYVADVLAGTHWLDEQIFYHPRSKDAKLHSWSLIKQLRARQLDAVLLMTNSLRTGVLAWASGAATRVGLRSLWSRAAAHAQALSPAHRAQVSAHAGNRRLFAVGFGARLQLALDTDGVGHFAGG